jgi:2-keto-4-pentenoate hydratase/2-oxohepta-3-ene-1,7-dioic acid hydratase in catechol pathway
MAHNGAPGDRELSMQAFAKSARTVVWPGKAIVVDEDLGRVNVEGELAVVVRRSCRHLEPEQVPDAILGYTIGNDVTAVDQVPRDDKMTQAKNGDGFTPLGPWIEADLDACAVPIAVRVNGAVVAFIFSD